ncbi:uncharacterized protein wrm2 [Chelonus insularis]|uniref:uncharacterized protein wrm2 n=1 Tax=Chelonus insularis TaxID=460826 RepID=UPI00158F136D|nr:uncharacterized protein LOC118071936 [Chelonus insularis]
MSLHIFWPASACLTLFVVGVIMILIKYGPQICGRQEFRSQKYKNEADDEIYAREVSESIA